MCRYIYVEQVLLAEWSIKGAITWVCAYTKFTWRWKKVAMTFISRLVKERETKMASSCHFMYCTMHHRLLLGGY